MGKDLKISGALHRQPLARVYTLVNNSENNGFWGKVLTKYFSIFTANVEAQSFHEVEVETIPDDTPVDRDMLSSIIKERFIVSHYGGWNDGRTDYYPDNSYEYDRYDETHHDSLAHGNNRNRYSPRAEDKILAAINNLSNKIDNMNSHLDAIVERIKKHGKTHRSL